jgi:DNA-binding transcriptional LysR family regulator
MELHQVRYFLALATTLNFTRAAEASNVTQPALTKAIQKLEWEFGGDLVVRERRNTQLTELGRRVLPMLRQAMVSADAARAIARDLRRQTLAPLRLGLAPSVSAALVSEPLAALTRSLPGLLVDLVEAQGDAMDEALMRGDVHVGIDAVVAAPEARIDQWPLFEERYVAVARDDHPIGLAEVASLDLIRQSVWLERLGCDSAAVFRSACFGPGEAPSVAHRAAKEDHLQQLALAGLGVFLAPEHSRLPAGLVGRPLEGASVSRCVGLRVVSGRRHPPALAAFLRIARTWTWPVPPLAIAHATVTPPALRIVG